MWRCIGAFESPIKARLTLSGPHQDAQPSSACHTSWPGGVHQTRHSSLWLANLLDRSLWFEYMDAAHAIGLIC
jgi:hypothetical protein